ncbi:MAG: hypothetical protein AAF840_10170, partial [Bacteroidota bacterium]
TRWGKKFLLARLRSPQTLLLNTLVANHKEPNEFLFLPSAPRNTFAFQGGKVKTDQGWALAILKKQSAAVTLTVSAPSLTVSIQQTY